MTIVIRTSSPPLSERDLAGCEQKIGRPIPEPFRSFLLRHNGGEPDPSGFEWTTENGRRLGTYVAALFGVHDHGSETYDSLAYCAEVYLKRDRVPRDLFPFAADGADNLVVLGVEGERKGRVFFWDHNWEAGDDEPVTYRNVHPLADSFEAFLAMLHE